MQLPDDPSGICSAGISWHVSACLGLFPLTKYYSFY
jgi:hypothetical protein